MSDRVIQKFTQKREQPYEFKNAKAGYIFFCFSSYIIFSFGA